MHFKKDEKQMVFNLIIFTSGEAMAEIPRYQSYLIETLFHIIQQQNQ